jgi:hypothetical protein
LGDPNDLENSKDCRGAGGHGNQHVRLRRAQIDGIETICPALATVLLRAVADVAVNASRSLLFQAQTSLVSNK